MHVGVDLIWNVELNDPVYHWEVEASGCNVCAEQDSVPFFAESEVDCHSFLLLLMALQLIKRES